METIQHSCKYTFVCIFKKNSTTNVHSSITNSMTVLNEFLIEYIIWRRMLVNSSLYLTCFKCFLKDYLVYIKIYSSVCILKSNTHIHTYRHKHICPSTVLFTNMLHSNTFLQYSLGLTRITGCWHAITTKHQFSLKNIYRNLNSF